MADIHAPHAPATENGTLSSIGNAILNFFVRIAESNVRVRELERLNAMTDAQLAERGLKREDIVRHVFRDIYYV